MEVEFFATDRDRALESGISQLGGMYPPSILTNRLNDFQRKNALPPLIIHEFKEIDEELGDLSLPFNVQPIFSERDDVNFAIHFEASDCPAYQNKKKELSQSQEFLDMASPYVKYLAPRLKELTQLEEEMDLKMINNICSYLYIADFHKLELRFETTRKDLEQCNGLSQLKMFYVSWGDDLLWKLGSQVFYKKLVSAMDSILKGNEKTKMQLHFSHDYMMSIVLNGLGEAFKEKIPFASTLFFELHKISGRHYVRTLFNDQPMHFGNCKEDMCSFQTFKDHISNIHPQGEIQELCAAENLDFVQGNILIKGDSSTIGFNFNQFKDNIKEFNIVTYILIFILFSAMLILSVLVIQICRRGAEKKQGIQSSLLNTQV